MAKKGFNKCQLGFHDLKIAEIQKVNGVNDKLYVFIYACARGACVFRSTRAIELYQKV